MSALDALLDSRRVWRAQAQTGERLRAGEPTGHDALDAALPDGGWPVGAVSELLLRGPGSGELELLWPLLVRLTRAQRRVLLVAPPAVPYPAAWHGAGIELTQCHWLEVEGREALWAMEQALRAGCCAAVVGWLPQADSRILRRLQVAASSGDTLAFVHRPWARANEASPAALRLRLQRPAELEVLKCRGGRPPQRAIAFGVRG